MSGTVLGAQDIKVNKTQSLPLRNLQSSGEQSRGWGRDKNRKRLENSHVGEWRWDFQRRSPLKVTSSQELKIKEYQISKWMGPHATTRGYRAQPLAGTGVHSVVGTQECAGRKGELRLDCVIKDFGLDPEDSLKLQEILNMAVTQSYFSLENEPVNNVGMDYGEQD